LIAEENYHPKSKDRKYLCWSSIRKSAHLECEFSARILTSNREETQ
jgi:hypothetical protein